MSAGVDVLARFNANHVPVPESGCWLWIGDTGARRGYGRMRIGQNKAVRAHRLSYEIHVGPIPTNQCVCHKCDTPSCVSPRHLFLASNEANTADRVKKGRSKGGRRGALPGADRAIGGAQAYILECISLDCLPKDSRARRIAWSLERRGFAYMNYGRWYINDEGRAALAKVQS